MAAVRFDLAQLYRSIDDHRAHRALSWAAVAREVGVSASTIRRFAKADDAEADGVLALIRWLDVAPEEFMKHQSVTGNQLLPSGPGYVRVDMDLVATAQADDAGARGRTRTTIQRLVAAAVSADKSVASLTRLSET